MVAAQESTHALAEALFAAKTVEDVEALIAAVEDAAWRPLGDMPGNFASVHVGSDPADALMEKLTNAMDAHLELLVQLSSRTELESPRAAAELLLGIPRGHLEYIKDDARLRELAEAITLTIRESGVPAEPTIVVWDSGIGQHPDLFPTTLVSINQQNKRDKFYLIGAYGWGGVAAYAFCKYSLFVSRRDPRLLAPGARDEVGWTVVRYNDLRDVKTSKTGVYEYLCSKSPDGLLQVPRFDASKLPPDRMNWSGTQCTMVQYRLGRYANEPAFRGHRSLNVLCNSLLFDPVLPFVLREERPKFVKVNPKNAAGIVIRGNAARLAKAAARSKTRVQVAGDEDDGDEEAREALAAGVTYHRTFTATMDSGSTLTIRYWVIGESGKYKKDWEPARSYVPPEQAITVTHFGQKHEAYSRDLFDTKLGLTSLSRSLIVQVDCDDLDWMEKRDLLSTTRDRLRHTDIGEEVRRRLDTALRQDDWLKTEDRKRKERALGRRSKEQAERIRKLLEEAIQGLRDGKQDIFKRVTSANPDLPLLGDQPLLDETATQAEPNIPTNEESPIEYADGPTLVRVLNAPVRVPANGRAVIKIHIDAPDDYLTRDGGGQFIPLVTKGADVFKLEGFSSLRNGVMRCTVAVKGAQPGDRGRLLVTVSRPDALPLIDDVELVVTEPPVKRAKRVGKVEGKEQGPPVEPVYREDWPAYNFTEETVAKLIPRVDDPTEYTIYVNWDYPPLDEKLREERKFDEELISNHKEHWVASLGFLVWLQKQDGVDTRDDELRRAAQIYLFSRFTGN